MGYINEQIMPHFKSRHLYIFCSGLTVATYFGKKILEIYQKKKNVVINKNNTLYFLFHFFFNMYSVSHTIKNVVITFHNPLVLTKRPNTLSFYVLLFHIYHVILTKGNIALDEWLHHIKVFILCPLLWLHYTNLCDFGMFFMTGLPGGITYLLLFLKNVKLIENTTEKYISKHLNLWIRAPGCIITAYLIYLNCYHGKFGDLNAMGVSKKFGIYLAMFGSIWNGMYFASTIVESYNNAKKKNISD
jgi:hypothetical protein